MGARTPTKNLESDHVVVRTTREEKLEAALRQILDWSTAYPMDMFPEADKDYLKDAHQVLSEHGMTLDRIAATIMRRMLERAGHLAKKALEEP